MKTTLIRTAMVAGLSILALCSTISQTLVWSDEFDNAGAPDPVKWKNELGYIRNNELQYYTARSENMVVANGNLEITGIKESFSGANYTSASINTSGKASWTYGRLEARLKLPKGKGIWPAFWTLGTNVNQAGWPKCGEIDILEHINNDDFIIGTFHWFNDNTQKHEQNQGYSTIDITQYHVYAVDWKPESITWYVDGNQYHQVSILNGVNGTSELHAPHYFTLNLAIGGDWPGAPDGTTVFPAKMYVDYVRVYKFGTTALANGSKPNNFNLTLSPNPAKTNVSIYCGEAWPSKVTVSLYSITGAKIEGFQDIDTHNGATMDLDISKLTKGAYLVKAASTTQLSVKKLIIN